MDVKERLIKEGIPFNKYLPKLENANFRDSKIIAGRATILYIFKEISSDKSGIPIVKDYIEKHGLSDYLTREESKVLNSNFLTYQQEINFSWFQESLYVLVWCLGMMDSIPPAFEEVDIFNILEFIPPDVNPESFIASANLRDEVLIKNELNYYYHIHWAKRHPESWTSNYSLWKKLNLSVIIERRKALEWVYNKELEWNGISLDT